MSAPSKPFGKLTLIGTTHTHKPPVVSILCVFRDELGNIWQSDHFPTFAFDMEFVSHAESVQQTTTEPTPGRPGQ